MLFLSHNGFSVICTVFVNLSPKAVQPSRRNSQVCSVINTKVLTPTFLARINTSSK